MNPVRFNLTIAILASLAGLLLLSWLLLSIISFTTAEQDLLELIAQLRELGAIEKV